MPGLVDEQGQLGALRVGEPHRGQAPGRTGQMLKHEHVALVRQLAFDGAASPRQGPLDQIDRVDFAFVVDADFLEVV